jgi:hypothetical protein
VYIYTDKHFQTSCNTKCNFFFRNSIANYKNHLRFFCGCGKCGKINNRWLVTFLLLFFVNDETLQPMNNLLKHGMGYGLWGQTINIKIFQFCFITKKHMLKRHKRNKNAKKKLLEKCSMKRVCLGYLYWIRNF